ncbi:MAG: tetratricopeptide repeat protein [Bryobacteraceae bacterium]
MKSLLALAGICALLFGSACTQSSQKLLAKGNNYHQEKKYKEASILYRKAIARKAIAKDKTNAKAYYLEGLNLLDQRNPLEASKFLRRAVDLNPNNTDAEVKLAEIYLFVYSSDPKKFKTLLAEVRELTSKVLQHETNSFNGIRLQGFLDLAERNPDKALASFAEANRIRPYSREIVGWYAQALVAAKRPEEAGTLTREMIAHDKTWGPGYDFLFLQYKNQNSPDKAEALLRERVANDPSSSAAVANLANYLLATNRFAEADGLIGQVIRSKHFSGDREMAGDFYVRAGKLDRALDQYQKGSKEDQKNALHYDQRIVTAYTMMGRRDDAVRLAKALAEKNPKDTLTNQMYASLLLETGFATEAVKSLAELNGLVQKNPADAILHLDLARAYFSLNENDKSLTEALEAIREQPKLTFARFIAAHIYEDRGQHPKALEQTDVILASEPGNADARLIRGRALIGLNAADRALPELEALLQQYPQMNDARFTLGNFYLTANQAAKASGEFQRMWSSDPPDSRGFIGLQNVKLAQGKGDEAVRALQDFIQKNPTDASYRYQLANVEASAGIAVIRSDPKRAKTLFQQAADNYKNILKAEQNSSDVRLRLGVMQRQLGEYEAALVSFEQAGTAKPHSAEAFLNRAMLLDALNRKQEAIDTYNKVLGIDPDNALALNNLAFLNAQAGANLDQAMTFAERAKKKYPNNPDISDTLGFVYFQKNLNPEAVRIFRQGVQDEPTNAIFHLHLAMALLKQGDKQGAREEAGKALKNASQQDEQTKIRFFVNQIG